MPTAKGCGHPQASRFAVSLKCDSPPQDIARSPCEVARFAFSIQKKTVPTPRGPRTIMCYHREDQIMPRNSNSFVFFPSQQSWQKLNDTRRGNYCSFPLSLSRLVWCFFIYSFFCYNFFKKLFLLILIFNIEVVLNLIL
jgi:hypothetical protein